MPALKDRHDVRKLLLMHRGPLSQPEAPTEVDTVAVEGSKPFALRRLVLTYHHITNFPLVELCEAQQLQIELAGAIHVANKHGTR